MKVVWVKSGGLLPLDTGGKIRSFNTARELARRHEVTLFTFYPALTPDPHDQLGDPFVQVERMSYCLPERASIRDSLMYAANTLTTRPYQMRKYCRPQVSRRLRDFLIRKQYDALVCDYLVTAGVVPWNLGIPTVLFTHNVEAQIWRRHFELNENPLWKLAAWREHRTIARAERHFTRFADHVLTVSEDDRKSFLEFLPDDRVSAMPTGVDLEYFQPRESADKTSLVFTGSMDWMPNEDAIVFFTSAVLPLIQNRFPQVTLSVVGRKPGRRIMALAERNPAIKVTGAVEDIRPFVQDASVYVVPIRIGGGTRIKIFEAMAMGKPVVSTSVGAEGLPVEHGTNILLADTPADFAARTIDLLSQPLERDRLGRSARLLVEHRYGWAIVVGTLEHALFKAVEIRETP